MALCKSTVYKLYSHVIEDVVNNVRDIFSDEGVDEQVLQELKALWESKLNQSKAVDMSTDINGDLLKAAIKRDGQQAFIKSGEGPSQQNTVPLLPLAANQPEDKMIPIQITLPTQPTVDSVTRVLTIHVPASALNGAQLHNLLTGPVITATMGLPTPIASSLLQQHVNAALQSQQQQLLTKIVMPQVDGASGTSQKIIKSKIHWNVDGTADTSDEDDDGSDEEASEEEIDEEKEDDDGEIDDGAPEEEPLNSEDDVTDEEPADLFDTENVVVCQYDKITRSRNKWKFYLKDGIMNLEGEDFVFQKATGDAEW